MAKVNSVEQPVASMRATSTNRIKQFLNTSSIYWLELVVAMIALMVSGSVIATSIYALCNAIASSNSFAGYASLWFAASAVIWVPLAIIFYARVRGHEYRTKGLTQNTAQRTLVIIYQVLTLITAIAFAFVTVYSFLMVLTQSDDIGKSLLQATLPSLISAALFGFLYTAFFKNPWLSRKVFLIVFSVVAFVIVFPSMVASIIEVRTSHDDTHTTPTHHCSYRYGGDDCYYNNENYYN